MADYSKLTKRELIMTLYARDLMLENERKHLEEYKQSLKETIDHYEKYCSEINHQNIMVYAAARNYEDKCKQLQDQLALTEKALELACDRIKHLYCSDYCGRLCDDWTMSEEDVKNECKIYYKCWNKECILQQAKEMMKSE